MASFRKLSNGWQFRISYKKPDGAYGQKSGSGFRTKTEAKKEADKIELQLQHGGLNSDRLFIDYILEWYDTFKRPKLSPVTQTRDNTTFNAIRALFPNVGISKLSRAQYQNALNIYGETHAKSSVEKVHIMMKECLNYAEYNGDILKNPSFKATVTGYIPNNESSKYLNKSDANKLIQALRHKYHPSMASRAMCLLSIATGMRIGECMGLLTDCIDFENKEIHIKRSFDYRATNDLIKPKTHNSVRKIAVDENVLTLLKDVISYNQNQQLETGLKPKHDYVFYNKDLEPISTVGANKALRRACIRADVQIITFHALRHTHASIALSEGVPIEYISKRLGHSNVSITSNVYIHLLDEIKEKSDSQINILFNNMFN